MKKYNIKYTERTLALPAEVLDHLADADENELKALILLAACEGGEPDIELAGMSEEEFEGAAAFLRGAGLIGSRRGGAKKRADGEKTKVKVEKKEEADGGEKSERSVRVVRRDILPEYTASEIKDIMREDAMLSSLIVACQQTLGKTFNAAESNVIIALKQSMGLDGEYILMLLAHCAEKDKKNLTYIQRTAAGLVESGILTPPQLEEEFRRREEFASAEGALRRMFGIGGRALTKKESEIFKLWINERAYSVELINEAYERTVAKTGKASVPYCNTILEDWFANGIKTAADAKAAASGKKTPAQVRGSFETDDFFGAALNRSMAGLGEK